MTTDSVTHHEGAGRGIAAIDPEEAAGALAHVLSTGDLYLSQPSGVRQADYHCPGCRCGGRDGD